MSEQNDYFPPHIQLVPPPLVEQGYRDPGMISCITIFFIFLELMADVVSIPVNLAERAVLLKIQAEAYETQGEMTAAAEASDMLSGAFALLYLAGILAAGISFLVWSYRIVKNAHLISYRPLRFTPGWAVFTHFIPILNLFRPYQALSDAFRAGKNPGDWVLASGSYLLGWWWGIHLASHFVENVAFRLALRASEVDELLLVNAGDISLGLTIRPLLNIVALFVVWKLCHVQQVAYRQIIFFPPPVEPEVYAQPIPEEDTWVIPTHTSGWAIAAGYVGLFAVLLFPAPIAFILGIVALGDCKKRALEGRGRAIFAMIMGAVFSLIGLLFFGLITLGSHQ